MEQERLSREQFKKMFKIELPPELTDEERIECEQINTLFDAVIFEREIREWEIFKGAYSPKREAHAYKKLCTFLKDVRTCPKRVKSHAQKLLNESTKRQ